MEFLAMALFALGIAGADQITKLLVINNIEMGATVPAIPGLFHFTQVHNIGAAFSILQGMRWLFVALFLALTAALFWEYFKKRLPFTVFERWCLAAIYGGGLGNIIDRIFRGYVVDMIAVEFMDFPVFNLADSFISCGCVLLLLHLAFFNRRFWKETPHASDG